MATRRAAATAHRRQTILDAALACFAEDGYERATLADIRRRAGASTGSIYHHFESKEQIAASLYVQGIEETQDAGVRALLAATSVRDGITAQVGSYIDWVVAHPAKARFLLTMRHGPFLAQDEPEIERLNAEVRARVEAWFADRLAEGDLPAVDPSLRRAIVFGPCRHWAEAWLDGVGPSPDAAKAKLARAAVAAYIALIDDAPPARSARSSRSGAAVTRGRGSPSTPRRAAGAARRA